MSKHKRRDRPRLSKKQKKAQKEREKLWKKRFKRARRLLLELAEFTRSAHPFISIWCAPLFQDALAHLLR